MSDPVTAQAIGAAPIAAYLAFLGRQLARRNQTGAWFDGLSASGWDTLGAEPGAVARLAAPGIALHGAGQDAIAAACAWVRALRIRRAAIFLNPLAIAGSRAAVQPLAAAGRIDAWLLIPLAAPDAERAALEDLRAVFPPQAVHPTGLRLTRPDGARHLLAFASADRNTRGQALGLKAAEFLIQGARRATPPAPPCRSPPAR